MSDKNKEYKAYINEHVNGVIAVWKAVRSSLDLDRIDEYLLNARLTKHDESKRLFKEFDGYRQRFYPDDEDRGDAHAWERSEAAFQMARNHHQKANDHHWEYWCLISDKGVLVPLPMTRFALIEMLCDWTAMSVKFNNVPSEWFLENKHNMLLHPDTERDIMTYLDKFDRAYNKLKQEKQTKGETE